MSNAPQLYTLYQQLLEAEPGDAATCSSGLMG
jgi:hypothetical protein